ncbi:Uncharacterised protein [Mycobacteroides abscessus subsp. bolletii]|nr:Uncharacterised protein [Mycobacteroides abscessus subsp. bolletii]
MYQRVSLVRRGEGMTGDRGDVVVSVDSGGRDPQQLLRAFESAAQAVVTLLDDCKRGNPDPRVRLHPELPWGLFTADERARVHTAWVAATRSGAWEVTRAIVAAAHGQMKDGASVLDWLGEPKLAERARSESSATSVHGSHA